MLFPGVRMSNLSKQEDGAKKQSTITDAFKKLEKSPRKHKLPEDNADQEVIPAKRQRLSQDDDDDITEVAMPQAGTMEWMLKNPQAKRSVIETPSSLKSDSVDDKESEFSSDATEVYWNEEMADKTGNQGREDGDKDRDEGEKNGIENDQMDDEVLAVNELDGEAEETSNVLEEETNMEATVAEKGEVDKEVEMENVESLQGKSVTPSEVSEKSSDDGFAKPTSRPPSAALDGVDDSAAKARDTPTTRAMVKEHGSAPMTCPVCSREFKSRNMVHITRHIEKCLTINPDGKVSRAESEASGDGDSTELRSFVLDEDEETVQDKAPDKSKDKTPNDENNETNEFESEIEEITEEDRILSENTDLIQKSKDLVAKFRANKEEERKVMESEMQNKSLFEEESNMSSDSYEVTSTTSEPQSEDSRQTSMVSALSRQTSTTTEDSRKTDASDKQVSKEKIDSTTKYDVMTCPVCNVEQKDCNLQQFNLHIDQCLQKSQSATSDSQTRISEPGDQPEMTDISDTESDQTNIRKVSEGDKIPEITEITDTESLQTSTATIPARMTSVDSGYEGSVTSIELSAEMPATPEKSTQNEGDGSRFNYLRGISPRRPLRQGDRRTQPATPGSTEWTALRSPHKPEVERSTTTSRQNQVRIIKETDPTAPVCTYI